MVEASNDNHCMFFASSNHAAIDALCVYGEKYWAKRFFGFLAKITEIKSMPKDEKSSLLISLFTK